jgi:hypothetical protein
MGAPAGNQNARKAKRWQEALVKALAQYKSNDVEMGQALTKIAERVVVDALSGSKDAWQEIGNRLDGKPAQVIIGDEDESPILLKGMIQLVRPGD